MKNIKDYFYNTGKILYKIAEVPFNILVGNYSPENQKIIKENRELRNKMKTLDRELENISKTKAYLKEKQKKLFLENRKVDGVLNNLKYVNSSLN